MNKGKLWISVTNDIQLDLDEEKKLSADIMVLNKDSKLILIFIKTFLEGKINIWKQTENKHKFDSIISLEILGVGLTEGYVGVLPSTYPFRWWREWSLFLYA